MKMNKVITFLILIFSINISFGQSGWVLQSSGLPWPVNKIYFLNESTGFMCGSGGNGFTSTGFFARSTNGGNTWENIIGGSYGCTSFLDFSFMSYSTGWLIGTC